MAKKDPRGVPESPVNYRMAQGLVGPNPEQASQMGTPTTTAPATPPPNHVEEPQPAPTRVDPKRTEYIDRRMRLQRDECFALDRLVRQIRDDMGLNQLNHATFYRVALRIVLSEASRGIGRVPFNGTIQTPSSNDPAAIERFEEQLRQHLGNLMRRPPA